VHVCVCVRALVSIQAYVCTQRVHMSTRFLYLSIHSPSIYRSLPDPSRCLYQPSVYVKLSPCVCPSVCYTNPLYMSCQTPVYIYTKPLYTPIPSLCICLYQAQGWIKHKHVLMASREGRHYRNYKWFTAQNKSL